ncbi:response regulator transcription factor [Streptomyces sp. NPDC052051]|uniref:response regulator n=1 Tax=Streptomyces sp. NPDC052051 TaxID=3154649 RepID=UPI00342FF2FC
MTQPAADRRIPHAPNRIPNTQEPGPNPSKEAVAPRVLIADDEELIRTGFRLILTSRGIEVIGEAADGVQAIAEAERLHPDVLLMDIRMPHLDGLQAAKRVLRLLPHCRVLMLTTFDLDRYVYAALAAGASGFLLKDVTAAHLAAAVRPPL